MNILLTNDDGIYAPGITALAKSLRRLGNVTVVAPQVEHSGVGHKITFLTPLSVKKLFVGDTFWGFAVDGSPADCVKIGMTELCETRPNLVVSGINGGLNVGINTLYSGTVAAAVEGGLFGVPSIAVSIEASGEQHYAEAADMATTVIEHLLAARKQPCIYNINIPLAALKQWPQVPPAVKVVRVDPRQYWEQFERRVNPFGRTYFWMAGRPDPQHSQNVSPLSLQRELADNETDIEAIAQGFVTVTPLIHDLTHFTLTGEMQSWKWDLTKPAMVSDSEDYFDAQDGGGCLLNVRCTHLMPDSLHKRGQTTES